MQLFALTVLAELKSIERACLFTNHTDVSLLALYFINSKRRGVCRLVTIVDKRLDTDKVSYTFNADGMTGVLNIRHEIMNKLG